MRPLHLRIEAFGPYPDPVEIDFRRLADHGLFVVSGATGAGKTSIFDAMTFALFGRLAGQRSGHRAIKSEHASDDQMCRLELEFAIRDERWRVIRQPRQLRTKARGTGTTEVAPTALLERFDGTDWIGTAEKVSEVDAAVRELVGLDADKFQRVVLLPQGQFQEVLLASTDERKKLLRALFGTERFETVQDAIKQHSAAAREATAEVDRRRTQLLDECIAALDAAEAIIDASDQADAASYGLGESAAASDATGQRSPSETVAATEPHAPPPPNALHAPDASDALTQRSRALRDHGLARLATKAMDARTDASAAELRHSKAVETNSAIADQAAANAALATLIADVDGHEQRLSRIAAARRAEAPLLAHQSATRAASLAAEAAHRAGEAWQGAQTMLRDPLCGGQPDSPSEIDSLLVHAREQVQRFQAEAERAAARNEALTNSTAFRQQAEAARSSAAAAEARLAQLAAESAEIATKITESQRAAALLDGLRARARQSANQARAARDLVEAMVSGRTQAQVVAGLVSTVHELENQASQRATRRASLQPIAAELSSRTARRDEATQRSQLHRALTQLTAQLATAEEERHAASLEHDRCFAAYVAQAAPRLAAELHEGEPCAVCGGTDHPNPAVLDSAASAAAVDSEQLAAAQASAAEATHRLAMLRTKIENHLEQLGAAAQLSPDQVDEQEHAAIRAVVEANDAIDKLEALDAEATSADIHRQQHVAAIEAARADLSGCVHEAVRLGGALTDLAPPHIPEPDPDAEPQTQSSGSSLAILVDGYRAAIDRAAESAGTAPAIAADAMPNDDGDGDEELSRIVAATAELAETLHVEADEHLAELTKTEQLADEGTAHQQRLTAAETQRAELVAAIESHQAAAHTLDGQASQEAARAEQLASELTAPDPAASQRAWGRSVDALEQAQRAVASSETAADASASADALVDSALAEKGFATVDELLAAALPTERLDELVRQTERWTAERTTLQERVASFAAANLPDEKLDVDALKHAAQQLVDRATTISGDATKAELQLDRADTALGDLAKSDAESESIRQNALEWHQLEQTCSGKNPANIDLESWVLATYLERVVELANAHLRPMTRGRYELQISTSGSRVIRRGLDLEAFDRSSGTARPVITLSGGETFMASLSLALGLADAVTSARGGMQLDALFVDEGFGSLDGDTLDAAIEVLDGLRSAGTMVGLITHVPAMKEALPVAIEVGPAPDGGGSIVRQLL